MYDTLDSLRQVRPKAAGRISIHNRFRHLTASGTRVRIPTALVALLCLLFGLAVR